MGMLKKSVSSVSRRQEIGRGLRLAVDQRGERMDNPALVHDINELTVVTDESYTDFVTGLQREIAESLSSRPTTASPEYFAGKIVASQDAYEPHEITEREGKAIYNWLIRNDFINDDDLLTDKWFDRDKLGPLPELPEPLRAFHHQVAALVDGLFTELPTTDGRKPKKIPLNQANFARKEFQELWGRINHRAVYQVEFDSDELIQKAIRHLDTHLHVAALQYEVKAGQQREELDVEGLTRGDGFAVQAMQTHTATVSASSQVKYDLLGEIAEKTHLIRRTVAAILQGISPETFAKFRRKKLKKHVYDYVVTDSKVERDFVAELDNSTEAAVYAKLPRGFFIPTPVGDYNPDWAIAFTEGSVKHVYFVAETKGSLSTLQLKGVEEAKIECARKFFESLSQKNGGNVTYDVVTDYSELMQLVMA